jgi:hypothetical protein
MIDDYDYAKNSNSQSSPGRGHVTQFKPSDMLFGYI